MIQWTKESKIPIKSWCLNIEGEALKQAIDLSLLSVAKHHVALMPDCHSGFGMPIGGVVALEDAIAPNLVGVDIGCGMGAIRTNIKAGLVSKADIEEVIERLGKLIPVGFNSHDHRIEWTSFDNTPYKTSVKNTFVSEEEINKAKYQLGTLGGGNHFLELDKDTDGKVWLLLHSGSRNFGYGIAKRYHEKAIKYCEDNKLDLPNKGLAYFHLSSDECQDYFNAMTLALDFAKENRRIMMEAFKKVVNKVFKHVEFLDEFNIHHNYAAIENHFGSNLIVHRKGAVDASIGSKGLVPGSMGTSSYIVEGLGNDESFRSCSHGAGRKMARGAANRTIDKAEADRLMHGIVHQWGKDRKGSLDLSEAPQAYKDIDVVMEAQSDLAKPIHSLTPMGVLKG